MAGRTKRSAVDLGGTSPLFPGVLSRFSSVLSRLQVLSAPGGPGRAAEQQLDVRRGPAETSASRPLLLQGPDPVGAGSGEVLEVDVDGDRLGPARRLELRDLRAAEPSVELDVNLARDANTNDLERHSLLLRTGTEVVTLICRLD